MVTEGATTPADRRRSRSGATPGSGRRLSLASSSTSADLRSPSVRSQLFTASSTSRIRQIETDRKKYQTEKLREKLNNPYFAAVDELQPVEGKLEIYGQLMADLSKVRNASATRFLYLRDNIFRSFTSIIPAANSLQILDLSGNQLKSWEDLEEFAPTLQQLYLNSNKFTTFEGFPIMPNLQVLSVSNNAIESFEGLPSLPNLMVLGVAGNHIRSLKGYCVHPELRSINVSGNPFCSECQPEFVLCLASSQTLTRIDGVVVSSETRACCQRFPIKATVCVTYGWNPPLAVTSSSEIEEQTSRFLLEGQREISRLGGDYELLYHRFTSPPTATVHHGSGSDSDTVLGPVENRPIMYQACFAYRGRRSLQQMLLQYYTGGFTPLLLEWSGKIESDSDVVEVIGSFDQFETRHRMQRVPTSGGDDDGSAVPRFQILLIVTPDIYDFKFVVRNTECVSDQYDRRRNAVDEEWNYVDLSEGHRVSCGPTLRALTGTSTASGKRKSIVPAVHDDEDSPVAPSTSSDALETLSALEVGSSYSHGVVRLRCEWFVSDSNRVFRPVVPTGTLRDAASALSAASLQYTPKFQDVGQYIMVRCHVDSAPPISFSASLRMGVPAGSLSPAVGANTGSPVPSHRSRASIIGSGSGNDDFLLSDGSGAGNGGIGVSLTGGNSVFNISNVIQPGEPCVLDAELLGDAVEGGSLALSYRYSGGEEGNLECSWLIEGRNNEVRPAAAAAAAAAAAVPAHDAGASDPQTSYSIRAEDIGSRVVCSVTAIRSDGVRSRTPVYIRSDWIQAGPPTARRVFVLPRADAYVENSTVTAQGEYTGGSEGRSLYQWFRDSSTTGDDWELIQESTVSASMSYTLTSEDVGRMIRVLYTPVRSDGVVGKPVEFVIEQVLPGPPRVTDVRISTAGASLTEGDTLSVSGLYSGGTEGRSRFQWYRRTPAASVSASEGDGAPSNNVVAASSWSEIHGASERHYRLHTSDIGFEIGVKYTPVRSDGVSGESRLTVVDSESDESRSATDGDSSSAAQPTKPQTRVVLPCAPRAVDLKVVGTPMQGERLQASYEYIGGSEGRSEFQWHRSRAVYSSVSALPKLVPTLTADLHAADTTVSSDSSSVNGGAFWEPIAHAKQSYYVPALDDCGRVLCFSVRPVRSDGFRGFDSTEWYSSSVPTVAPPAQVAPVSARSSSSSGLSSPRSPTTGSSRSSRNSGSFFPVGSGSTPASSAVTLTAHLVEPALPTVVPDSVRAGPVGDSANHRISENGIVEGQYEYYGGYEGDSQYRWYRLSSTNEKTLIAGATSRRYQATHGDYGCRLEFHVRPVRRGDGLAGVWTAARVPTEPVQGGDPTALSIEWPSAETVSGKSSVYIENGFISVSGLYSGGEEGASLFHWFRVPSSAVSASDSASASSDRSLWVPISDAPAADVTDSQPSSSSSTASREYHPHLADVGSFIAVQYTPVRSDGAVGQPIVSFSPIAIAPALPMGSVVFVDESPVAGSGSTDPYVSLPSGIQESKPVRVSTMYSGGVESTSESFFEWFRVAAHIQDHQIDLNPAVPSDGPESPKEPGAPRSTFRTPIQSGAGLKEYTPVPDDVGRYLAVRYTPVRNDGVRGAPVWARSGVVGAGPPRVFDVRLSGVAREGRTLTAFARYVGGEEGTSRVRWLRVMPTSSAVQGAESSVTTTVLTQKYVLMYKVTDEDAGARIRFEYTPVRSDGVAGATVFVDSPVVEAEAPTGVSVEISGEPVVNGTLRVRTQYRGGREGSSTLTWVRYADRGCQAIKYAETAEYQPSADDLNAELAVVYTPVREDGVSGQAIESERVRVLLDPAMKTSILQLVSSEEMSFELRVQGDDPDNRRQLLMSGSRGGIRVNRWVRDPKASSSNLSTAAGGGGTWKVDMKEPLSDGIEIKLNARVPTAFLYASRDTNQRYEFFCADRRERDLITLSVRIFVGIFSVEKLRDVIGDAQLKLLQKSRSRANTSRRSQDLANTEDLLLDISRTLEATERSTDRGVSVIAESPALTKVKAAVHAMAMLKRIPVPAKR